MVTTTRRLDELQAQCREVGVAYEPSWGREALMDALRAAIGTTDLAQQVDPMKAKDLKGKLAWGTADPYAGIADYLTTVYVAEPKLDGARMLMFLGATGNTMNTGRRSVKSFGYTTRTDNFPHLRDAIAADLAGTILDGEILAPTKRLPTEKAGEWTDSLLNASVKLVNSAPEKSVRVQQQYGRAQYWVFDVLSVQGEDVTSLPYIDRRAALELIVQALQALHPECEIRLVPQYEATADVCARAVAEGFEGVMLKRTTGRYEPGKRSVNWLKVKAYSTADAFVVGWSAGENSNSGKVGSLDLAVYLRDYSGYDMEYGIEEEGAIAFQPGGAGTKAMVVRPVAQVGNLVGAMRDAISASDGSLKPEYYGIVIEFMAQGLGKNGRARHPHMVRLRPDKAAEDCRVDQLDVFARV